MRSFLFLVLSKKSYCTNEYSILNTTENLKTAIEKLNHASDVPLTTNDTIFSEDENQIKLLYKFNATLLSSKIPFNFKKMVYEHKENVFLSSFENFKNGLESNIQEAINGPSSRTIEVNRSKTHFFISLFVFCGRLFGVSMDDGSLYLYNCNSVAHDYHLVEEKDYITIFQRIKQLHRKKKELLKAILCIILMDNEESKYGASECLLHVKEILKAKSYPSFYSLSSHVTSYVNQCLSSERISEYINQKRERANRSMSDEFLLLSTVKDLLRSPENAGDASLYDKLFSNSTEENTEKFKKNASRLLTTETINACMEDYVKLLKVSFKSIRSYFDLMILMGAEDFELPVNGGLDVFDEENIRMIMNFKSTIPPEEISFSSFYKIFTSFLYHDASINHESVLKQVTSFMSFISMLTQQTNYPQMHRELFVYSTTVFKLVLENLHPRNNNSMIDVVYEESADASFERGSIVYNLNRFFEHLLASHDIKRGDRIPRSAKCKIVDVSNIFSRINKKEKETSILVNRTDLLGSLVRNNLLMNIRDLLTKGFFFKYEGEAGIDHGGLTREVFDALPREAVREKLFLMSKSADTFIASGIVNLGLKNGLVNYDSLFKSFTLNKDELNALMKKYEALFNVQALSLVANHPIGIKYSTLFLKSVFNIKTDLYDIKNYDPSLFLSIVSWFERGLDDNSLSVVLNIGDSKIEFSDSLANYEPNIAIENDKRYLEVTYYDYSCLPIVDVALMSEEDKRLASLPIKKIKRVCAVVDDDPSMSVVYFLKKMEVIMQKRIINSILNFLEKTQLPVVNLFKKKVFVLPTFVIMRKLGLNECTRLFSGCSVCPEGEKRLALIRFVVNGQPCNEREQEAVPVINSIKSVICSMSEKEFLALIKWGTGSKILSSSTVLNFDVRVRSEQSANRDDSSEEDNTENKNAYLFASTCASTIVVPKEFSNAREEKVRQLLAGIEESDFSFNYS